MKNTKRLLAVLLALVMALSCLAGLSFADNSREQPAAETETAQPAGSRGFKSTNLQLRKGYQLSDDELVMAIVLLEGKAPAELAEAQRAAAATRVAAQHNTLRNELNRANIRYTVNFEYDSLLNGMAITVAYGDLDKIGKLDGVKAVYIANQYEAPVLEPATRMASSNEMTGTADFQQAGYKGKGMVIAVLDTGITPDHEAFQVYGDKLGDVTLDEATAKAFIDEKGYGTYLSEKIPFSYDYYDLDNDATDDKSGHGTHVSGIAAGYAETEEGEITFCGTAPYAQIVAMKVFSSGSSNGTNSGIYFAALEDCYELGVDVINMSLGAQNGNVYDPEIEDEVYGNIYMTLEDNGIILCASAGNENSMAENASNWAGSGYVTSDYADYGVVGTPSTYDGNMSVASLENAEYPANILRAGDREIPYYDSDAPQFATAMAGKENVEFVVIDGYGAPEDFAGVDVKGKIALISRGDITFEEKVQNAARAGAIAALIYNNQDGVIFMSISNYNVPAASITKEDGEYLISLAKMPEAEPETVVRSNRGNSARLSVVRKATDDRKAIATRDFQFTAVTNEGQLVDGWYLIGRMSDGKYFNGAAGENINKAGNYVTDAATEAEFTAAAVYYNSEDGSLKTSDDTYIYGTDGSNGMFAGSNPVAMSISFDEGYAIITNNNTQFAFNSSWDGFRFYKTSSTMLANESSKVIMYKLDSFVDPDPQPISTDKGVLVGWYFESEDEIEGWSFVDADDDGYDWYIDDENDNAYQGNGTMYSVSWYEDALTPDDWAITPAINLDGIEDAELSLWYNSDPDFPADVFAVYGGTSADPDAMTKLTDDITATGAWKNLKVDLADYAGETIYLAIRHYNCTDMDYLDIDNVEILTASVEPIAPPEPPADVLTGWYFESEDELTGWTFVDKDDDGYNWNHDMTAYYSVPYEGNGSIYSESYHNNESGTGGIALEPDNWAISPAINLDGIEESYLSLWYVGADEDYAEEVFALYAGTSADPDAMTKLTDDITASGNYQQAVADLSDFAGETIYVAIRHYNVSDMFVLSIDNVEICKGETPVITTALENAVAAATALDPEGYTEESFAAVSAALQTANAVLQNPDSTQAEVDAALAELNAALAALVRVLPKDDLGGEAVYGWYFESDDELADWTSVDADGDGYDWFRYETEDRAYEGVGVLTSASWYDGEVLTPDNWAITPAIDLTGIEDAVLSLFYRGQDAKYPDENFAVYVGEEADPDKMTDVSGEYTATGEYQQLIVDLSAYANTTIYVAIRHFDTTDMFRLNIDMVEIRTGTTYEPPVPVDRPIGVIDSFPEELVIIENPDGWQMSDFSSWGVTPILTLKPQITGVGGDVYSASFNTTDGYEVMSGTSMSSPNVTGMMANVLQFIDENITNSASAFVDVYGEDYYYDPVQWAVENGVTNGTSPTTFSPAKTCTREQIVTFLWRAEGTPEPTATSTPFTDVVAGSYYEKAVLWAVENGVTNGVSANRFGVGSPCTRGQAVTFLWRAAGQPEPTTTVCPFTDVTSGDYFYKAVLWAVENGVTNGTSATAFSPARPCTRGQIVTFLFRAQPDAAPASGKLSKVERAELAEDLVKSTALILTDAYGDCYSPRKQGAGLAQMGLLAAANAYITEPIADLFDNADGEFEIRFTVKDIYGKGASYQLTPIVQTDYPVQADLDQNEEPETYNSLSALTLKAGEDYTVEAPETVTVPANGEVEVTVKITLTAETKEVLDQLYPNGSYIEGFIVLDAVEGEEITEEIHATFVGFYGDWTKAPILEQYDWRDIVDADNWLSNTAADEDGNTYADYGYTYLDAVDFQVNTDINYAYALNYEYLAAGQLQGGWAGDNLYGYDPDMVYNDARIAIAPGTGITDTLYMMPYNIRNVRHLIMVATDAETGEVYYVDDTEYLPKVYFDSDYAAWSNSGTFLYDGTDAEGNVLPNGTKVNLTYYANLMYGEDELGTIIGDGDYAKLLDNAKDFVVWEIPVTIDTEGPTLVGEPVIDEAAGTVTVKVTDNEFVAAVFAADESDEVYDAVYLSEEETGAETELTFALPEDGEVVTIYVEDYATNETTLPIFIGEPAPVSFTLAYPDGTTETCDVMTGDMFTAPIPTCEVDKGEFTGAWVDYDIGDVDADTMELYLAFGLLSMFYTDEPVMVTSAFDGLELYPLYYVEEIEEGSLREDEPVYGWYFESVDEFEGWTMIDADGDGNGWEWHTGDDGYNAFEGDGIMTSASYINGTGALTPDNWAITPAIDLTEINEASLSLWARGQDASYAEENFAIYAGETADPDAMTKVGTDIVATGEYINYVADLSAYAGKTIYVAIRHYDVTDMYWLNVDQVEIFDKVVEPDVAPRESYYYTTQPNGTPEPPVVTELPYTKLSADQLDVEEDVIIVNPAEMKAISNADSDVESYPERYRLGVDVALAEDGRIWTAEEDIVWHMVKDENGYKFVDADGKALSVPSGYNNLVLDSDCIYWNIVDAGDGNVYLISTESKGTSGDFRGIEYYQEKFTTFYASETNLANNADAFTLQLFCGPKG